MLCCFQNFILITLFTTYSGGVGNWNVHRTVVAINQIPLWDNALTFAKGLKQNGYSMA